SKFPDPNVPEADGFAFIAMGLQPDRAIPMWFHLGQPDERCGAQNCCAVLDQYAIVQYRDYRLGTVCAIFFERGGSIDNVVGVPFARLPHGIHYGGRLLVDAAGLPIHIRFGPIGVQNLQLIDALQEHAAVSAHLALAVDPFGYTPFDVQLEVTEYPLGLNVAGGFVYRKHSVRYRPLRVLTRGRDEF